jgi:enediyne biosynthesis protein E2
MPAILGTLRRLALTPSLRSVTFAARGFPGAASPAAEHLEAIPQSVICGFEWGIEHRRLWDVERRLETVAPELRGFAYEGAAMAYTARDAMAGGRGRKQSSKARELLAGTGAPHIFLTYIGIGFAMARLPRVLWRDVLPDLSGSPYHPTMSWLAVDGYGFDRAYFDTRAVVDEQRVLKPYPWTGASDYFPRAVDQGIGRALWFINGALPDLVTRAVGTFAEHRRADLWSGVGLAATFAGGCSADGLARVRAAAGEYGDEVALGSVFAAKARTYAGCVPEHSRVAVETLTGLSVREAEAVADATEVAADVTGPAGEPAYEVWRERIRSHFHSAAAKAA